jgi:HlyD family secretion protein
VIRRFARPAVAAEANDFQSDLDALVGAPVPLFLRAWPAVGAGLCAALLGLAMVTRIDVVVTAPGRLTGDVPPVVLQPVTSAVLGEVRVRPGEAVRAGDVLAVLDSTFTAADREALEAQRRALTAERDRLMAELDGRTAPVPDGQEAALQGALQNQRADVLVSRRAAFEAQLAAVGAAERAEREAGAGLRERLAIARDIEAMRDELLAGEVGSRLSLLEARAARVAAEQDLRQHRIRLDELANRARAGRAELDAFLQDWRREALEALAALGPELARVEEQLAKAARLDAMTHLTAPRDGVVLEVARRAPGSLIREGEAVVTLVPSGVPLIAEVTLRSADIGRLGPGTEASLKVDSFPWRRHGTLPGTLRAVSRESWPAEGGRAEATALHRGQIVLGETALQDLPSGAALLPGMTLVADLKIGTRSVLDFFLEPLVRGLHESLREP